MFFGARKRTNNQAEAFSAERERKESKCKERVDEGLPVRVKAPVGVATLF